MPTLDAHESSRYAKLIYIGDSGTGKTGSLVSLLAAGYKLKILDMDAGLDSLVHFAREQCPTMLGNVEYETYRDEYRASKAGPVIRGTPTAFVSALAKMEEWANIEDDKTIFVLDSGSAFGKAAFEWAKGMSPMAKDPRQWYFAAQQAVEATIAMLTGNQFKMNVIVITHVNYKELTEGVNKGYANFIGSAIGPVVAKYFNTLILAESQGAGANTKRKIKTLPNGIIDLKVPNPKIERELPLETGLATIIHQLKGN